eukprot:UN06847
MPAMSSRSICNLCRSRSRRPALIRMTRPMPMSINHITKHIRLRWFFMIIFAIRRLMTMAHIIMSMIHMMPMAMMMNPCPILLKCPNIVERDRDI